MKNTFLILLGLIFSQLLSAQRNGIYLTYDDYVNHKIIEADKKSIRLPHHKNGKVKLKIDGVKKKWKLSEIWGVRKESQDFRSTYGQSAKDGLIRVVAKGIYVYYYFEKEKFAVDWTYALEDGEHITRFYVSKTLDGTIYPIKLSRRGLKKFFREHGDEFKELVEYRKRYPDMRPYKVVLSCINDYNQENTK
jgi:hypothetical protein